MSVWASQRGNWEGQCTKMSTKSSNSIKKSDIWCLIYINRYIWPYPANIKRHFQDAKPLEKFEIRHFQRQLFSTLEIDKLGKCQDGALLVIESHRGRGPPPDNFHRRGRPPSIFRNSSITTWAVVQKSMVICRSNVILVHYRRSWLDKKSMPLRWWLLLWLKPIRGLVVEISNFSVTMYYIDNAFPNVYKSFTLLAIKVKALSKLDS